jgi:queuine/archaeosine tRNA-ribosyltransferase
VRFYLDMVAAARVAIEANDYPSFKSAFLEEYQRDDGQPGR